MWFQNKNLKFKRVSKNKTLNPRMISKNKNLNLNMVSKAKNFKPEKETTNKHIKLKMNPKTNLKPKVGTKTTHLYRKSLSRLLLVRVVSNPDPVTPPLGRVRFECPTLRRWSGSPDTHICIYIHTYIHIYIYIYIAACSIIGTCAHSVAASYKLPMFVNRVRFPVCAYAQRAS